MYTVKQAEKVLDALKQSSPEHEADLANVTVDPEIFNFPEVKSTAINAISALESEGVAYFAFGGQSYAWKDDLNRKGFKFNTNISDVYGVQMWLIKHDDLEVAEFEEIIAKMYGWDVEVFDDFDIADASLRLCAKIA